MTGSTGLAYDGVSTIVNQPSGSYINLNSDGTSPGMVSGDIVISSGPGASLILNSVSQLWLNNATLNLGTSGQIVDTSSSYGASGQVLMNNSNTNPVWQNLPSVPNAQGPTGAIQLSDGAGGFSGSTELTFKTYAYIGGGTAYEIGGGSSLNAIVLQGGDNRDMLMYNNTDGGTGSIGLYSGGPIDLSAGTTLKVNTSGSYGTTGQYLGSDGAGNVVWSTPPTGVESALYQATYYKTTAQNLTSGNTDITFDGTASWNNDNGYITHTNGTTVFTVVQSGLYQLEFNTVVLLNGASWSTTSNKTINIDITRVGVAEQTIISSTGIQGVQSYSQSISTTFYLNATDEINLRLGNIFTSGPPQVQQLLNTYDFNTFFTWRYVSTGPAGPTGATGATGSFEFLGPTGAILYYDGSAVTGSTAMTYNGQYTLQSINNDGTNSFALDDGTGNAQLTVQAGLTLNASPGVPGNIALTTGNGRISLITAVPSSIVLDELGNVQLNSEPTYYLQVSTNGSTGTTGQYLGSDGAGNVTWSTPNYVATPPVIQAAGTTPLTSANVNTTYILTSGATQNFTTTGLGAGDVGKVWYVKNASTSDIDIEMDGGPIGGVTSVLHTKRNDTNTPSQILYWDGNDLIMY